MLCLREEIENGVFAALIYEIERDALARPTTEPILAQLTESTTVVVVVNLQRQRRLLRGRHWMDEGAHPVRRPHFLRPIHSVQPESPGPLRDASENRNAPVGLNDEMPWPHEGRCNRTPATLLRTGHEFPEYGLENPPLR